MKVKTVILQTGANTTGIEITEKMLEQLGGGKRPLVVVTINGYSYRSAVGKMGDKFMVGVSAENRKKANVAGGDKVEISLELDTAPRTIDVPEALQKALNKNKTIKANFEKLAPSKKKAIVLSITEAKSLETKMRRIEKTIEGLK